MKTYFSRITYDHWARHNNAEKQAHAVAIVMDRLLIHEDEMQQYQQSFMDKISEVNKNNPRCKPLKLDIWNIEDIDQDIGISIDGVFNMELFLVEENGYNMKP